jgi:hypothetical protein
MENLASNRRVRMQTWGLLVLVSAALGSYACGQAEVPPDDDGLGGSGGGIVVVQPSGGTGGTGGSGGSGGTPVVLPPFEACALPDQGTLPSVGTDLLIDDFDDGDEAVLGNGLHGNWYDYDDDTTGTLAPSWDDEGGWKPVAGGIEADGYALHAAGSGFIEWGSGQGISPIWDEGKSQECLFDASQFDGVSFWIKGAIEDSTGSAVDADSGVLKFGFVEADVIPVELGGDCTGEMGDCYDWHKVRITPTECWQHLSYTWDEFEQDGWGMDGGDFDLAELVNVNFEIAQGHTFDYWVDELEFFSGDPPEADEICDDGVGGGGGAGGAGGP